MKIRSHFQIRSGRRIHSSKGFTPFYFTAVDVFHKTFWVEYIFWEIRHLVASTWLTNLFRIKHPSTLRRCRPPCGDDLLFPAKDIKSLIIDRVKGLILLSVRPDQFPEYGNVSQFVVALWMSEVQAQENACFSSYGPLHKMTHSF